MNFLRENGKSAKTDDNSLKFVLIDKKPTRKNSTTKDYGMVSKKKKRRSSNETHFNLFVC
jgi:hypothetical protein